MPIVVTTRGCWRENYILIKQYFHLSTNLKMEGCQILP